MGEITKLTCFFLDFSHQQQATWELPPSGSQGPSAKIWTDFRLQKQGPDGICTLEMGGSKQFEIQI